MPRPSTSQYFLDYYMPFCPNGCDKEDCPKDEREDIPSPRGCPRQGKELYSRGDLGILTKDELEFLKSQNEDPDIMIFRQAKDIPLKTFEDHAEHLSLMQSFGENKRAEKYFPFYIHYQLKRVRELQRLADVRRDARNKALATIILEGDEVAPKGGAAPNASVAATKEPSADAKLRAHLKDKREDIFKTNTELAEIIGEKPENVRKTKTWKLVSALHKANKKVGRIKHRLNSDWLDDQSRNGLKDELEEAKQELAVAKLELPRYLGNASGT